MRPWGSCISSSRWLGRIAIFMPMHYLGMAGQTAAVLAIHGSGVPAEADSAAHVHYLCGDHHRWRRSLFSVINLFWSMFKGPKASDNPWEATTLEWTTATPPPHDNFGGKTPVVYHGPYEYGVPGAAKDYVMQTDPATVGH